LDIIAGIIKETSLADTIDGSGDEAVRYSSMANAVGRLWAMIFAGNHILDIDNTIGSCLVLLADSSQR
jgi:hypothetical protein